MLSDSGVLALPSSPDKEVLMQEREEVIERALACLPPREAEILKMRFGFYGKMFTLEEIGQKLGIVKETVRTREKEALIKLRLLAHHGLPLLDYYRDNIEEEEKKPYCH